MSIFSNDESDAGYSRHLVADSGNPLGGGDGFASRSGSVAEHPHHPQPPVPAPVRASPTSASASSPNRGGFHDVTTSGLASPSFPSDDREIDESKCKYGKVTVGEPTLVKGRFEVTGHHEFKVSCSSAIVEHVSRRYSDFVWLRAVLVKAFPGIFIAPLPPKSLLGSKGDSFVEGRRIDLQRWLARIVTRPFLADHQAVELFLQKATSAFESDQKELTKAVENQTCGQTIATYKELFPEILRLGSGEDSEVAMETLSEFIKQSETKLNALVGATEKFVKANHEQVQDLAKVTSFFQQAFELEKGFVRTLPTSMASQPIAPRVDLNDAFTAWQLSQKWSSNAYDELFLAPFNYEHQDIQAMQELMKNYSELAARHKKSVAKAQKWLEPKNAPKNEKQEAQKFADDAQARDEGVLLDLVSKLIIHAQFEQFWTFRMVQFRKRLHRFAKHQMEATKQLHDTWQQIAAATAGQDA